MNKRLIAIIAAVVLAAGLVAVGIWCGSFVSQKTSAMVVTGAAAALIVILSVILVIRYHRAVLKKDTEIRCRDELFSTLSDNVDDILAVK